MVKNLKTVSLMLLLMGTPFVAANATAPSVSNVNAVQQNSVRVLLRMLQGKPLSVHL